MKHYLTTHVNARTLHHLFIYKIWQSYLLISCLECNQLDINKHLYIYIKQHISHFVRISLFIFFFCHFIVYIYLYVSQIVHKLNLIKKFIIAEFKVNKNHFHTFVFRKKIYVYKNTYLIYLNISIKITCFCL